MSLIIDCHGHYTTVPPEAQAFRDAQIAGLTGRAEPSLPDISDDRLRESVQPQLAFQAARGTDLNLIPEHAWPRSLIVRTADAAQASIGVCRALMDRLGELGADTSKLHTLSNGVDLVRFRPEDQQQARARLGLRAEATYMVAVGHLIERKGQYIAIDALTRMPGVELLLVGDGEDRQKLMQQAQRLQLVLYE